MVCQNHVRSRLANYSINPTHPRRCPTAANPAPLDPRRPRTDEPIEGPRPGEFVTKYELLSLQADPRVGMFRERDDLAELYHQRDVLERYTQRAS